MIEVIVIGSGDAFGSGGRFQTCIALAANGEAPRTLIDCGATSLLALRRQSLDPNELDTVVLTHLHGDHFGGLPFLILDGQFRRRTRDLTIIGPPGTADRLSQALEVTFPGSSEIRRRFAVHVLEHADRTPRNVGPWQLTPYEVRHASGAPAYAVQLRGAGGSVAYSGDTEWTDALLDASDGVDLFLCEAYSAEPIRWHLDLQTLETHRHRLTCRQLVLTHLSPTALAADLTTWTVAHDGLHLSI